MNKNKSRLRSILLIIGTPMAVACLYPAVFLSGFAVAMSSSSHDNTTANIFMYPYWCGAWIASMHFFPTLTVTCVLFAIYQWIKGKEIAIPLLIPFFYFAAQMFLFFVLWIWVVYLMPIRIGI